MKRLFRSSWFMLLLPVVFYFAGACFIEPSDIEPLKRLGYAEQEEYTYTDSDGEEHEDETLIELSGVGKILTYKDVYFASIPIFTLSMIFGGIIFKNGNVLSNDEELKHVIFANCILGLLLIWLTTKGNVIPTILFWLGVIAAGYAEKSLRK